MLTVRVRHTHLYPGARGSIWCEPVPDVVETSLLHGACSVEFSDGAVVQGNIAGEAHGAHVLKVGRYTTGRGTEIEAKCWLLEVTGADQNDLSFRVLKRLPAPTETGS